jgi:arylsulfatase
MAAEFSPTAFNGTIALDIRDSEPDWGPFAAPTAAAGAPNVLYVVWDDVGIATWDCFGVRRPGPRC